MKEVSPAIVLANYYQFERGQIVSHPRVESCMLLWCKNGRGTVKANDSLFCMAKDDFLLLPWGHAITYMSDEHTPLFVGGVHLIPAYALSEPLTFEVAHSSASRIAGRPGRGTGGLLDGAEVFYGVLSLMPSLGHLAEYVVSWFQRGEPDDRESRMLGHLFMMELSVAVTSHGREIAVPGNLSDLIRHITAHISCDFSMSYLASFMNCSPPTVTRMFRIHMGISPIRWVVLERLSQAANLLMTTNLPVGEIGRSVGIDDPYYFTKRFKCEYGATPSQYRKKMSILVGP